MVYLEQVSEMATQLLIYGESLPTHKTIKKPPMHSQVEANNLTAEQMTNALKAALKGR